ncbi:hypothetical protein T459_27607 [Capsicum annuum]|uniref:Uncharacterized protein n=1 Tax=Capsicum annuum TaxID=4072 RepID=A0A2G2YEE6_CAPAN|nr:hypothetical protein T459_27607 [Capsicum annuum]
MDPGLQLSSITKAGPKLILEWSNVSLVRQAFTDSMTDSSGDSCDDDFEDYDCEEDENYDDEDCGENKNYVSYSEECEYGDSYAFNNDLENDDASRYESSTYSSCDTSNSEENDYELDDDNKEILGEYSCSSFYYDSKHENGSGSYVCFVREGGCRSFTKKLRQTVNRYATYDRNIVYRPNDDMNTLINGDHFVEQHECDEAYIDHFVEQRKNMFHIYDKIKGLCCAMIIHNKSFINIASSSMVEHLKLKARKYSQPYELPWPNEKEILEITKQVLMKFQLGKFQDEVLCDVIQ